MANEHIDTLLGPAPTETAAPDVVESTTTADPSPDVVDRTITAPAAPDAPPQDGKAQNLQHALHEERKRRQELQQKLEGFENRWGQTMDRIVQGQTQPPAKPDAIPDPDVDPLGHLEYQNKFLANKLQQVEQFIGRQNETQQFAQGLSQVQQRVAADEQAFAKDNPGYAEAANWVMSRRQDELNAMGLAAHEVRGVVAQEAFALAQRAYAEGTTPAAKAWDMAQKLGWKPANAAAAQRDDQGRFVAQPTSLAATGGAPVKADVGLSDNLSEMSSKDFDAMFAKMMKGS
jgi:hypothetical protein